MTEVPSSKTEAPLQPQSTKELPPKEATAKGEVKGGTRLMMIAGFAIFGVFAVCIGLGFLSVYGGMRHIIKKSSPTPLNLTIASDLPHLQQLKQRIRAAVATASKGETATLELNLKDLNTLITDEPSLDMLKGAFRAVEINKEFILLEMSFPIERVEKIGEKGKGLYFNGQAKFLLERKKKWFNLRFIEALQQDEETGKYKKVLLDALTSINTHNSLSFWPAYMAEQDKLNLVREVKMEEGKITLILKPAPKED